MWVSRISVKGQKNIVKSLLRWMDRTKIILHVLQSRTPSDPVVIPVSPNDISSSNVIVETVSSVILAFVSKQ